MSVAEVVRQFFSFLSTVEQRRLLGLEASPQPSADGAAVLLGHDLRVEPVRRYHDALVARRDPPPPLWQFSWESGAPWNVRRWLALPFEARQLRARAGSLTQNVERRLDPATLALDRRSVRRGLAFLRDAGLARGDERVDLAPIAPAAAIATDLALVELIVHWLRMLEHRDRILGSRSGDAVDVCGYAGACSECRLRWASVPRELGFLPPFHPGCRCFTQPRWADAGTFDDNLIAALEHPIPDVAATAARVLGARTPPRALAPLLRASQAKDPERAEAALEALAHYRDAAALERLERACENGTARERAIARAALRRPAGEARRS